MNLLRYALSVGMLLGLTNATNAEPVDLSSATSSGLCPGAGDCCVANGSGSCDDFACCDLVCSQDISCCEAIWDSKCVALAGILCDQCNLPPRCPGEGGDCCAVTGNFTPGCDRFDCCETVCDLDGFCCRVEWDDTCARKARQNCINACECPLFGDLDGDGIVNLADVAAFQNCFSGPGGGPVAPECACADSGDGDVDLADAVALIALLR